CCTGGTLGYTTIATHRSGCTTACDAATAPDSGRRLSAEDDGNSALANVPNSRRPERLPHQIRGRRQNIRRFTGRWWGQPARRPGGIAGAGAATATGTWHRL